MNNKKITIIVIAVIIIAAVIFVIGKRAPKEQKPKINVTKEKISTIYKYAQTQRKNKDYDNAIKSFKIVEKEATEEGKRKEALVNIADMYLEMEQPIAAREYYEKLVELYPDYENISEVQKKIEKINIELILSPTITENSFKYQIRPNDTLGRIARDFDTTVELLKKSNNLKSDIIIPGRFIKVPKGTFSILVDKSRNLLSLKRNGEIIKTYSVATGKNNCTPTGVFKIEEKLISPTWYKFGEVVKPESDDYELGTRWMGISVEGYGIHGTKNPDSIGRQLTAGCVRMLKDEVEELYTIVPSGTEVVIQD